MQSDLLTDIRVLVTRPEHQAQTLCDLISELGGQAIRFPVIAIEALPLSEDAGQWLRSSEQLDFAIFISANAVQYGLAELLAHGGIPDTLKLVSIGRASADKMLQLIGKMPDIYPKQQFNSEALLALSELQESQVRNKRVMIFRGRGGRELLATTLRQRGAIVHYAEVYQRLLPIPDQAVLQALQNENAIDIVTVTSNEGLHNLVSLWRQYMDVRSLELLWQMPLVVVSEKMRLNARQLGFKNAIMVAAKASNEALLTSIRQWHEQTLE